jgi:hypothetical protein
MVFYNLQIEKRVNYTYTYSAVKIVIYKHKIHSSHVLFHTYISSKVLAALQQMSPSLLHSQSRLSLFTHHVGQDA